MKKLLIILVVIVLSGCSAYESGEGTKLKREMEFNALGIITDKETGCQYISQIDGGMTPRLNAEGKLYCKKETTP